MSDAPSPLPDRLVSALADRYRIIRELGAGGMATVYLAEDLKHHRQVAVKVLRPELAAVVGGERFVAEIRTTANLTHPNILPLFDSGEADSFLYYVMPYMEGETLGDLLRRKRQMGVAEAVRIASEVAEALDFAHRNGIVHRDVKPANILLQDGRPLVSDFGIALAVSEAGGGRLTETGLSVGTPHYMSPEQATGDPDVDARADIYSLGCVLFEMLTGEPPYGGGSAQAILARILTGQPDRPTTIRSTIPPNVEGAIMKAMEKLPVDRFGSAAEFAAALKNPGFRYGVDADPVAATSDPGPWRSLALAALAAAVVLPLGVFLLTRPAPVEPPATVRSVWATRAGQEFRDQLPPGLALSRDGRTLVYLGPAEAGTQLWVKYAERSEGVPIPGTTGAQSPALDPTGRWVAFIAAQEIRKVPLAGGPVVTVSGSASSDIGSIAWLDNGKLAFNHLRGYQPALVDADGGEVEFLDPGQGDIDELTTGYNALADGAFLMTMCTNLCLREEKILAWHPERGMVPIVDGFLQAWYVDSGHLVLIRSSGDVFAAPFDLKALEITGELTPLFEGVEVDQRLIADMVVSRSGEMLAHMGIGGEPFRQLVWMDRSGASTPVDPTFRYQLTTFPGLRISPDGSKVALSRTTDDGTDIWIKELDEGPAYRLTYDAALEYRPSWYPDGDSLLFVSERQENRDLFRRRTNSTGPVGLVIDRPTEISQGVVSPDGDWLVYREGTAQGRDIWAVHLAGDSVPQPLVAQPGYDEKAPALSPDGRWLIYESDETGQDEIYLRPFPNVSEGRWQISLGGGREPVWARSGREVFYINGRDMLVAAQVNPGPPFRVEGRDELFELDIMGTAEDHATYDVAADDQRFIFSAVEGLSAGQERYWLRIDNWTTELSRIGDGR
jgi:hypothetical protein